VSHENVEIVRAGFEAWNAGDMDAYRELLHPEVTMRAPPRWPEPGPFVGRDAVLRQCIRLRDAWDSDTAKPTADFIDLGDRVVTRMIFHSQGQGPEMNMEISACTRSGIAST
jgi:ketosteroid isomerase-like protein